MSLKPFSCLFSFTGGFAAAMAVFLSASSLPAQTSESSPPPAPRRANIIVIVADHLSISDLGCYGRSGADTPNIDRLAKEGARFTCFYAGSPADAPARATLLTGMDAGHLDVPSDSIGAGLSAEDSTVAQYLKGANYYTGLIGKWALGTHGSPGAPQNKGFDDFIGFLSSDEAEVEYSDYAWRYHAFLTAETFDGKITVNENTDGKHGVKMADFFTTTAMNFIHNNKPAKYMHWRAFFLWLGYPLPRAIDADSRTAVENLDMEVGRLMEKLKSERVENNTVIVFTSANCRPSGVSSGRAMSDVALRAPLIVWYPTQVKPAIVKEPWAAWDLFPTLAELARMDAPTNIDGISFLPTLAGTPQTKKHEAFYWMFHDQGLQQATRFGSWKAIQPRPGAPIQLFDLGTDPNEKTDVAGQHPEVVAKVEAYFKSAMADGGGK